jgi:adenylyltransferase/sulfurtransferase
VLPGIIGTIQASEALKCILGIGELLTGRLLCFNALDMTFYEAAADKNRDCAVCGEQPKITKIDAENYLEMTADAEECRL